ncbi:MAG: hypothetical protein ACREAK_01425 [Nitrosarchaeum sp.]
MAEASFIPYLVVSVALAVLGRITLDLRQRRVHQGNLPTVFSQIPAIRNYSRGEQIGFVQGVIFGMIISLGAHVDFLFGLAHQQMPGWLGFLAFPLFLLAYLFITVIFVVVSKILLVLNQTHYTGHWRGRTDGMLWSMATLQIILFFLDPTMFVKLSNCCVWT